METITHTNGAATKPATSSSAVDPTTPAEISYVEAIPAEDKMKRSLKKRSHKRRAPLEAPAPIMPLPGNPTAPEPGTIPFTFEGDRLDVVRLPDGDVGVTLKRLCQVVGLTFGSQLNRLRRTAALGAKWAGVFMVNTTGADQKVYEMVVVPRRSIPMWAATADASRAQAPNAKAKLVAFQDQAADVLASAFVANHLPLAERVDAAVNLWTQSNALLFRGVERRLAALERSSGTKSFVLLPQVDPEQAGFSMESMNSSLSEAGYNISRTDTAVRSIAAKLQIIGDPDFGFWNSHSDSLVRGAPLQESWRFSDVGAKALQGHMQRFCELKAAHEAEHDPEPRQVALNEVLDKVIPIGISKLENLTRTRGQKRTPFPGLRRTEHVEDYQVMLTASGPNKIQVIKAIRELTSLGLKEAKDLMESAPQLVRSGLSHDAALRFQRLLVEAGATVTIEPVLEA